MYKVTFTFGNLAPDSGIPNETWTEFDPPKEVTHILEKGDGEDQIRDLVYYREYLVDINPQDNIQKYSFRFGYFTHLICDMLWIKYLGSTTKTAFHEMIVKDTVQAAIVILEEIKYIDATGAQSSARSYRWSLCFPIKCLFNFIGIAN